jgi:DNA-binding FrmR family transcriptional regulator
MQTSAQHRRPAGLAQRNLGMRLGVHIDRASFGAIVLAGIMLPARQALATETIFTALLKWNDTSIFIIAILVLTFYFSVVKFDRFAVVHGPEILTTAGIFGCFWGISTGLLNFDATHIAESVPQLLGGVKTAFLASLTGVFGALAIRLRHRISRGPIPQSAGSPKAASLDDLVSATLSLKQSIAGDDDSTLISQIRLTRQESADQLRGLRSSFDTFAAKMVENNSRALVDALREVIRDFNAKINEQFGENFRHLNEAVEKLVVWQAQYKSELSDLIVAQTHTSEDMDRAANSFGMLVSSAQAFSRTAEQLATVTGSLEGTLARSVESETALHGVLTQMRGVIPEFNRTIDTMLSQITTGATRVSAEVEQSVKVLTAAMQSSHGEMKKLLAESLEQAQRQVLSHIEATSKEVHTQVLALDKSLSEELTKALETLGRQLASLSEKFVADYTPLTERLRGILELAGAA